MSYTFEDFNKEFTINHLNLLSPQDRLRGMSIDDILQSVSHEEILKKMPPDEIVAYLKRLQQN